MMSAVNQETSGPNVHPSWAAGGRVGDGGGGAAIAFLDGAEKELVEIDASPVAVVNSEATPPKLESTL